MLCWLAYNKLLLLSSPFGSQVLCPTLLGHPLSASVAQKPTRKLSAPFLHIGANASQEIHSRVSDTGFIWKNKTRPSWLLETAHSNKKAARLPGWEALALIPDDGITLPGYLCQVITSKSFQICTPLLRHVEDTQTESDFNQIYWWKTVM